MKNIYEVYEFYKTSTGEYAATVHSTYFTNKNSAERFLRLSKKNCQYKKTYDFGLQKYVPDTPEYNDLLEYLQEKNIQVFRK